MFTKENALQILNMLSNENIQWEVVMDTLGSMSYPELPKIVSLLELVINDVGVTYADVVRVLRSDLGKYIGGENATQPNVLVKRLALKMIKDQPISTELTDFVEAGGDLSKIAGYLGQLRRSLKDIIQVITDQLGDKNSSKL